MDGSTADTAWVSSSRLPEPVAGGDGTSRWAALVLDPDTASVARARRWARETVDAWDADGQEWTLSQLLTEVVTNAVLHADTRFRVRLEQDLGTRRLRCEVTDTSAARPRVRHHTTEATTGRGLQMVADLARGWGVLPLDSGKTVWFEVEPDADLRLGSGGWSAAETWLGEPMSPPAAQSPSPRASVGLAARPRPDGWQAPRAAVPPPARLLRPHPARRAAGGRGRAAA